MLEMKRYICRHKVSLGSWRGKDIKMELRNATAKGRLVDSRWWGPAALFPSWVGLVVLALGRRAVTMRRVLLPEQRAPIFSLSWNTTEGDVL